MISVHELVGLVICWSARFVTGTTARWVNCRPSTQQRIYYANHSSHLDIMMLWSSLPREIRLLTRPAAARDYWEKSAFKRYLANHVCNVIYVDRPGHGEVASVRDPLRVIENTLEGMGDKYSLIIFPEGTRGEGDEMAPFKGGIHMLAKRKPGIELVPVYLENLNRILPKGEFIPVPILSSISFGPPLALGENENKRDFLIRARQAIIDLRET